MARDQFRFPRPPIKMEYKPPVDFQQDSVICVDQETQGSFKERIQHACETLETLFDLPSGLGTQKKYRKAFLRSKSGKMLFSPEISLGNRQVFILSPLLELSGTYGLETLDEVEDSNRPDSLVGDDWLDEMAGDQPPRKPDQHQGKKKKTRASITLKAGRDGYFPQLDTHIDSFLIHILGLEALAKQAMEKDRPDTSALASFHSHVRVSDGYGRRSLMLFDEIVAKDEAPSSCEVRFSFKPADTSIFRANSPEDAEKETPQLDEGSFEELRDLGRRCHVSLLLSAGVAYERDATQRGLSFEVHQIVYWPHPEELRPRKRIKRKTKQDFHQASNLVSLSGQFFFPSEQ